MNASSLKILVAERVDVISDLLETVLTFSRAGNVFVARTTEHAEIMYDMHGYKVALIDLDLLSAGGLSLAQSIKGKSHDTMVVLMASYADPETIDLARDIGVDDLLIKPFSYDDLSNHVKYVISRKDAT